MHKCMSILWEKLDNNSILKDHIINYSGPKFYILSAQSQKNQSGKRMMSNFNQKGLQDICMTTSCNIVSSELFPIASMFENKPYGDNVHGNLVCPRGM